MQLNLNNNPSGPSQQVIDDYTRFFNGEKNDDMLKYAYMGNENNHEAYIKSADYYIFTEEADAIKANLDQIVKGIPTEVEIYEIGPGSEGPFVNKVYPILQALKSFAKYVAIDSSDECAECAVSLCEKLFPEVKSEKIIQEITSLELAKIPYNHKKRIFLMFGITVGNFNDQKINHFFESIANILKKDEIIIFTTDNNMNCKSLKKAYQNKKAEAFFRGVLNFAEAYCEVDINKQFEYKYKWNKLCSSAEFYFVAKHDFSIELWNKNFHIKASQALYAGRSKKFNHEEVEGILYKNNFKIIDKISSAGRIVIYKSLKAVDICD